MKTSPRVRRFYWFSLAARLAAFLALAAYALAAPQRFLEDLAGARRLSPLTACWLLLMGSMVFRLFPSSVESLGCQKAYARRARLTGAVPPAEEVRQADRGAWKVLALWAAVNALFFLGYAKGWLGRRFLVCLAGFYGVCDIVCILFYCPFQSWLMHNRCCTTCRIYDWDYLMLCTPLLAIPTPLTLSACALAAFIFLRWEVTYRRRRERFFESTNEALRCANCREQLCRHKRQLARWLHR